MGRRRKHAPKRGSLAYLPRGRAARTVGRLKYWPELKNAPPTMLGFAGYKAGMTYAYIISDRRGANFDQEVITPVTVVETPPMIMCGFRAYSRTHKGVKSLTEVWANELPKDLSRVLTLPESFDTEVRFEKLKESIALVSELRAILCTMPRLAAVSQKKPEIMEVKIDGGAISDQLSYLKPLLGRETHVSDIFKEGQFVDVVAVTKGKGIQGPVKRWGVKKLRHKSRKTVRGVGCIGAWSPHYVMYSVPRAGQMGFHQRTEINKRVLKIGSDGKEVTPKGGFNHYGIVKSDFIMLSGSVPGPSKRLIKIRYPTHPPNVVSETSPRVTYLNLCNR